MQTDISSRSDDTCRVDGNANVCSPVNLDEHLSIFTRIFRRTYRQTEKALSDP